MPKKNPEDFGSGASSPPVAPPNAEAKLFRVILMDGQSVSVTAFRLFGSYDPNLGLGLVLTALRSDESIIGTFYRVQGWVLVNPQQWATV